MKYHTPSLAESFVRLARPGQWVKNVLVAGVPLAAGRILERSVLASVGLAFVAWCLLSSAAYALNDVRDRDADAQHPRKRNRPVASGAVSPRAAIAFAIASGTVGLLVAAAESLWLFAILVLYLAMNVAYSIALKSRVLVDVAVIALGFVLRAFTGGVVTEVPISEWFIIVTGFGALFVAAAKRLSEDLELRASAAGHRAVLGQYDERFLEHVLATVGGMTLVAYALWAADPANPEAQPWTLLSILPFTFIVLRYAQLVFRGAPGEPELLLSGDRPIQLLFLGWAGILAIGLYA